MRKNHIEKLLICHHLDGMAVSPGNFSIYPIPQAMPLSRSRARYADDLADAKDVLIPVTVSPAGAQEVLVCGHGWGRLGDGGERKWYRNRV